MKTKALKFSLLLVVAIVVVVGAARTSLGEQRMRHRRARRSGTLLTLKVNKIHNAFSFALQYTLDLRKILGVVKKFLKSRSFLFQT